MLRWCCNVCSCWWQQILSSAIFLHGLGLQSSKRFNWIQISPSFSGLLTKWSWKYFVLLYWIETCVLNKLQLNCRKLFHKVILLLIKRVRNWVLDVFWTFFYLSDVNTSLCWHMVFLLQKSRLCGLKSIFLKTLPLKILCFFTLSWTLNKGKVSLKVLKITLYRTCISPWMFQTLSLVHWFDFFAFCNWIKQDRSHILKNE